MDITVQMTKEQHACVFAQLRKNEDGSDALTVQEWLQGALNGKINNCMKRNDPLMFLRLENEALKAKINENV